MAAQQPSLRVNSDGELTLYPDDLMCTPLFVSVDFILTKKDRSRVLSGARRLGLLDSTGDPTQNTQTERRPSLSLIIMWRKKFLHSLSRTSQPITVAVKLPITSEQLKAIKLTSAADTSGTRDKQDLHAQIKGATLSESCNLLRS